jgi:hypothetical protein
MSCGIMHYRHWFTAYGHPGLYLPACARCGELNPRPLTAHEWGELLGYRRLRGRPLYPATIEDAITAEVQRRAAAARKVADILAEIDGMRAL